MARMPHFAAIVLASLAGAAHAQIADLVAPTLLFREPPAQAQPSAQAPQPQPQEQPDSAIHVFTRLNATFGTVAGLSGGGEVSAARVRPGITVLIPVDQRSRLALGLDYEYSHYDFEGTPTLIPGTHKPWGDVHRESLSANYFRSLDPKWTIFAGGLLYASHEEGADFGKSIGGGGFAGFSYALTEHLRIGPGFGIFTQLEGSPQFVPIVSVDWQITKEWSLTNDQRPGLFLVYEPDEQWTLKAGAEWQSRSFRLSHTGALPDGVAREQRIPISFEVEYDATRQIGLSARAGVDLNTRYRTLYDGGGTAAENNGRASAFFGLGLVIRF